MKNKKHESFYKFSEFIIIMFISFYIFTLSFGFIVLIYMLFLIDWILFDFKNIKKIVKATKEFLAV